MDIGEKPAAFGIEPPNLAQSTAYVGKRYIQVRLGRTKQAR